jgi:hypothetical protein
MASPDPDFHEWIKRDPPPSLQELVRRFGAFSNITAEAWAEYDIAMAEWQHRRKTRLRANGATGT